jgi:hypothetical protein
LPAAPFTVKYEVQGGNQPQPGEFTVEGSQAKILKDVVIEGPPGCTRWCWLWSAEYCDFACTAACWSHC